MNNDIDIVRGKYVWSKIKESYSHAKDATYANHKRLFSSSEVVSKDARTLYINVNTDASGLGIHFSKDGRGITGTGFYLNIFDSSGHIKNSMPRYRFNAPPMTIDEAEVMAIIHGVNHAKEQCQRLGGDRLVLNLVTDSLKSIQALHEIDVIKARKAKIEDVPEDRRSAGMWTELRKCNLYVQLSNSLTESEILSVSTRWVRSHMLDTIDYNELKCVDKYFSRGGGSKKTSMSREFKEDRTSFHDMRNNKIADEAASRGAALAVKKRIDYIANEIYKRSSDPAADYSSKITRSASDFSSSREGARKIAIKYLATMPEHYLTSDETVTMLGKGALDDIAKEKMELARFLRCGLKEIPEAFDKYCTSEARRAVGLKASGSRVNRDFAHWVSNQYNLSKEREGVSALTL